MGLGGQKLEFRVLQGGEAFINTHKFQSELFKGYTLGIRESRYISKTVEYEVPKFSSS